jgi:hypothetical protein
MKTLSYAQVSFRGVQMPSILFEQFSKVTRLLPNEKGIVETKSFQKARIDFIVQQADMTLALDSLEEVDGHQMQKIMLNFGNFRDTKK